VVSVEHIKREKDNARNNDDEETYDEKRWQGFEKS
jgi:hypothetical protein